MQRVLELVVVVLLIVPSLYLGIAGWVAGGALAPASSDILKTSGPIIMDGIQFKNAQEAEDFRRQTLVHRWFPWIWDQPVPPLFIGCIGFGLLGGAIGRMKKIASGTDANLATVFLQWFFSGALAILLFFLTSYFLEQRPGRLIFFVLISLAGGVFAEETFDWLRSRITTILDIAFSKKPAPTTEG